MTWRQKAIGVGMGGGRWDGRVLRSREHRWNPNIQRVGQGHTKEVALEEW